MSIALDGFAVLRKLGKHAEAFAPVRSDVDKAARALVVKCLKAKSVGIDGLRDIYGALGEDQFALLLEGVTDTDVKSILTRLDKHHPEVKAGPASWRREHLLAVAKGKADASARRPKVTKTTAPKISAPKKAKGAKNTDAAPKRLQSDVMDLFREGGKRKG